MVELASAALGLASVSAALGLASVSAAMGLASVSSALGSASVSEAPELSAGERDPVDSWVACLFAAAEPEVRVLLRPRWPV